MSQETQRYPLATGFRHFGTALIPKFFPKYPINVLKAKVAKPKTFTNPLSRKKFDVITPSYFGKYISRRSYMPNFLSEPIDRAHNKMISRYRAYKNWNYGYSRFGKTRVGKYVRSAKNAYLASHTAKRNIPTFIYTGITEGRATWPGHKYLGPGNRMDLGEPTTYADHMAYEHDMRYGELQKKGVNPYFTWNEADREMVRANRGQHTQEAWATWAGLKMKKEAMLKHDFTPVSRYRWGEKSPAITPEKSITPYSSKKKGKSSKRKTSRPKRRKTRFYKAKKNRRNSPYKS